MDLDYTPDSIAIAVAERVALLKDTLSALLYVIGSALLVWGTAALSGKGWALVVAGVLCLFSSAVLSLPASKPR